jgi:nitrate reductase NapE component
MMIAEVLAYMGIKQKPKEKVKVIQPIYVKRKHDNDGGQIAVIMFFFLTVAFIAFYIFVVGAMMDQVTDTHNNLTQNGQVPLSQDRQDSMAFLQGAFGSLPIIAFIMTILTALIYAMASRYQVV